MPVQSTSNNVFVKVKAKYIKNITAMVKRAAIENLSTIEPSDYVNIVGEVVSLPKSITTDRWHEGMTTEHIKIGDTVLFSRQVIYDLDATHLEEPVYKNRIYHEAEEYFAADIAHIYGIIRPEGITMINGWVMLTEFQESKIVVPAYMKQMKKSVSSEIMYTGYPKTNQQPINAQQGDTVFYSPFTAQKYQINDKPFIIIPQEKIFGKSIQKSLILGN